jgi:hypothetical protein
MKPKGPSDTVQGTTGIHSMLYTDDMTRGRVVGLITEVVSWFEMRGLIDVTAAQIFVTPFHPKRGLAERAQQYPTTHKGITKLRNGIADMTEYAISICHDMEDHNLSRPFLHVSKVPSLSDGMKPDGATISILHSVRSDSDTLYDSNLLISHMVACNAYYGFARSVPGESLLRSTDSSSAESLASDAFVLEQDYFTLTPRFSIRGIFFENILGAGHLAIVPHLAVPLPWLRRDVATVTSQSLVRIALGGTPRAPTSSEHASLRAALEPLLPVNAGKR